MDVSNPLRRLGSRIPSWLDGVLVALICLGVVLHALEIPSRSLHAPYAAYGDPVASQYFIKTTLDHGWYTVNPDVGAPFGATLYDFPIPESSHFLVVRVLGLFTNDPYAVFNLFYIFTFVTVAFAGWWGFRSIGLDRPLAIAGALLFCLLPFHFMKQGHLFLTAYYGAALSLAYAIRLASYRGTHIEGEVRVTPGAIIVLLIAGGAGIYYAFFGCMFLAAGAIIGAAQTRRTEPLRVGAVFVGVICAVVFVNLIPNAIYHWQEGQNLLVGQRKPVEAEIYGLRIMQLLLPSYVHRIGWLSQMVRTYESTTPLINENHAASLGFVGAAGFITAVALALFGARGHLRRVTSIGRLVLVGVLFATIGGFGSVFAFFITPELRGLNRISVFIAFLSIAAVLFVIRRFVRPPFTIAATALLLAFAFLDTIPNRWVSKPDPKFLEQQPFFDRLQAALPPGTSVYELPYMYFPESPVVGAATSYALFEPYLRTHGLKWSFGEAHGRPSDRWNEDASRLSGADFAGAIASAGFGAVYVDRAAYDDHANALIRSLEVVLDKPILTDERNDIAVFRIPPDVARKPLVSVGFGKRWAVMTKDARGMPNGWSNGSSDLTIISPNHDTRMKLEFSARTIVARHITVRYGDQQLGTFAVVPMTPTQVHVEFAPTVGVSRLEFETEPDDPGAKSSDVHAGGFQMVNLDYTTAQR